MSKDPTLRGTPAPAGFAASVSGYLRVYVGQQRLANPSASMNTKARLDIIDACSSAAVAVGEDDPRVRSLAFASPGPRWKPGPEQLAVVHAAGHKPGDLFGAANDKLSGETLLNLLAHAALIDLQAGRERELSRLKRSADVPPEYATVAKAKDERIGFLEAANGELARENEHVKAAYIAKKAEWREALALVNGDLPSNGDESPIGEPEPAERLPAGVRQRGGSYESYWRADGQQRQRGGFSTAAEAAAHRTAQLEEATALAAARASQAGGRDTFHPSPEDLAAMQEAGTR